MRKFSLPCMGLCLLLVGCQRSDTDRLAKIGEILARHTESLMQTMKSEFSDEWKHVKTRSNNRLLIERVGVRQDNE